MRISDWSSDVCSSDLRETLATSGWLGTAASFAAGMIDPIMLLLGGAVAARGVSRGINLLNGGLATARAGLIGPTAAEALLHASQETRTYGESAAHISMTTFLGGLVGAGAGALANSLRLRGQADLPVPVHPRAAPLRPERLTSSQTE